MGQETAFFTLDAKNKNSNLLETVLLLICFVAHLY